MHSPITVSRIPAPTAGKRKTALENLGDLSMHSTLLHTWQVFHQVRVLQGHDVDPAATGRLRLVAWNAERCKHLDEAASLLRNSGADVFLLSELDIGMARTQQIDTCAALGTALGLASVFSVQYVELGLGTPEEKASCTARENRVGLHGNAILSRFQPTRAIVARLDEDGTWYSAGSSEPRVGSSIATVCEIRWNEESLILAAPHLRARSSPLQRAEQFGRLLTAIEQEYPKARVVIGGDMNTSTVNALTEPVSRRRWYRNNAQSRLLDPVPYELLFERATALGYRWQESNVLGATTRWVAKEGGPPMSDGKIDWFFTRGVRSRGAAVIPALARDGTTRISDHDAIAVTIDL